MKLTDKRFWKFEAMMLLCGVILLCQMLVVLLCYGAEFEMCNGTEFESCNGAVLILLLPALCLYFAISGVPTWLVYKGNSWLRLAGWLYLFSAVLLIIPLLTFVFDWNPITANMRPDNIPADEGKYFTDNEFIIMVCVGWAALSIIPVLIISYLTKQWIVKMIPDITPVYLLDSARRAVKGNVSPNVRAILMNYTHNHLILKCYLDSIPTDIDREMLSDISGEIVGDFPPNEIPTVTEICEAYNVEIPKLGDSYSFIYIRDNEL